jgi:hypothetical protein
VNQIFATKAQDNIKVHITKRLQSKPFLENQKTLAFFEKLEKAAKAIEVRVEKAENIVVTCLSNVSDGIPALDGPCYWGVMVVLMNMSFAIV